MAAKYMSGVAVLGLALLVGCAEEPPVVEIHEPGEYKGKLDPLLNKAGTAEHEGRLRERFRMVQTDR